MSNRNIVKGILVLTSANIITKILGFFYRVYMSNVIGAEGMGLFQLIMPLYMLVWSISSSGFSTTISKLVSEENAKRKYANSRLILQQCVITSTIIAFILSIILFEYSDYISIKFFKDSRISLSLKIMTTCFPFMAAGSCIRGYFFGSQENSVPAISQVLEQMSKMIIIYFLSSIFIPLGLEYASAIAVVGMSTGEIFSFFYVWLAYKNKQKYLDKSKSLSISRTFSYIKILKMSTPLTANRVLSSFLSTIENILIPQRLKSFGYTEKQAMSIFGQLSGMAMPLVMFTSSLLTSLSISIIPAISEASAVSNTRRINNTVAKSFLFTAILGIGTSGIFMTFPNELGEVIYSQTDLGEQIFLMGFICPFIYFHVTLSGILNGLGKQFFIFTNNLLSSIINISSIYFLTPIYGMRGVILGYFLSILLVNILGVKELYKCIKFNIDFKNVIFVPLICILFSCLTSKLIYRYLLNLIGQTISVIICIGFLSSSYLFLLIILKCIQVKDLDFLKIKSSKQI